MISQDHKLLLLFSFYNFELMTHCKTIPNNKFKLNYYDNFMAAKLFSQILPISERAKKTGCPNIALKEGIHINLEETLIMTLYQYINDLIVLT